MVPYGRGQKQTSFICGVIDDHSRSFKAIDERVFTNFRDKHAVFTNFRAKNAIFTNFGAKNIVFTYFLANRLHFNAYNKNTVVRAFRGKIATFSTNRKYVLSIVNIFYQ